MDSSIVIRPRGKCPICNHPFVEIHKIGFLCLEHKTVPKRLFLDFWHEISTPGQTKPSRSIRTQIYSTKDGRVLETYTDAVSLRSVIEEELRAKRFDPKNYQKKKQGDYSCSLLLSKFLEEKMQTSALSMRNHWKQHIAILADYFKDTDIRDIAAKKIHLRNLIKHLETNYVATGQWKAKTMKNCAEKFRHFLKWVKGELELVSSIPEFPEIAAERPMPRWVSSESQISILEAIDDEADRSFVAFLMLHGCRPGEGRSLKCKDIDLENNMITIHSTFSGHVYSPRRKGKDAPALHIPIHPEAYEFLRSRKEEAIGEAWVFINPRSGEHYCATAIKNIWDKARTKLKIPEGLRLYDVTRHTYASLLIKAKVPIFTVSKLIGHTTVKTTEKFYAHADLDSFRVEIQKVSLQKKVVDLKPVAANVAGPWLEKTARKKDK